MAVTDLPDPDSPMTANTSPARTSNVTPSTAPDLLEARYMRPYQMHASIGPSCAVGLARDDLVTVWSHMQGAFPLRDAIAEMLRLPAAAIATRFPTIASPMRG